MLSSNGILFKSVHGQEFLYLVGGEWYCWGEVYARNPEYAFLHKRGWISVLLPRLNGYERSSSLEFLLITGLDFYNSLQEIWQPGP